MKKSLLILSILSLCFMSIAGQIKVVSSGEVTIGGDHIFTTAPTLKMHNVMGNLTVKKTVYADYLTSTYRISSPSLIVSSNNGEVSVGSANSGVTMKITGSSEFKALEVWGDIMYNGTLLTSSDKKLKRNIRTIEGLSILDRIGQLDAKEYKFKTEKELLELQRKGEAHFKQDTINVYKKAKRLLASKASTNKRVRLKLDSLSNEEKDKYIKDKYIKKIKRKYTILDSLDSERFVVVDLPKMDTTHIKYGFLAQEVEEVFPDLVRMDSTTGLYAVDYMGFIPVNYSAIKELKKENDELKAELLAIREELVAIRKELKLKKVK